MITETPEIRAHILEWQKKYGIEDGDPALALIELVSMIQAPGSSSTSSLDAEAVQQVAESLKTSLLPAIERLAFQSQELQKKLETINLDGFTQKIEAYHEGIDYCTKKLDVVKKESDNLALKLEKTAASIKPITTGAVLMLMGVCGVLGFILATMLR